MTALSIKGTDSTLGLTAHDVGTVTLTGLPNSKSIQTTTSAGQVATSGLTFSQFVAYSDPVLTTGTYQIVVEFDIVTN